MQEISIYDNQVPDIVDAQKGNKASLEKLILNNNGLIWSIVKRFKDRGYEIEDLYQIAVIGFIKSIKKFDTSFDVKLSTYAVPYILGEIKRYIQQDGPIKISRSIKELLYKISEIQKEYLKRGKEITIEELAKEVNLSKEDVVIALESTRKVNSIYETDDDNDMELIEKIDSGEDEQNKIINKMVILDLMNSLADKEKKIIILRYFRGETQSEVAKIVGVNQVQISRIEKRVLENMRKKLSDNNQVTA